MRRLINWLIDIGIATPIYKRGLEDGREQERVNMGYEHVALRNEVQDLKRILGIYRSPSPMLDDSGKPVTIH